jgi:N-acetylneuraminic acid mutarotase
MDGSQTSYLTVLSLRMTIAVATMLTVLSAVSASFTAGDQSATAVFRTAGSAGATGDVISRSRPSGTWLLLPPAPIKPRMEYLSVWTGNEMIAWGGYSRNRAFGDGAAYDPQTRKWTKLPPSPLSPRIGAVGVWTGHEMLVFGGVRGETAFDSGAAYDPTTNTWRRLTPIPAELGGNLTVSGSYAAWTGTQMLVWGFFGSGQPGRHGGGSLRAALFDPSSDSWKVLAPAPAQAPLFGDAFWTGSELLVWGSVGPNAKGQGHLDGFAYDLSTNKWSRLPPPPLTPGFRDSMMATWTGRRLIVGGGETSTGNLANDAASFDPVTDKWSAFAPAPKGFTGNNNYSDLWTGTEVLILEDHLPNGRPLLFDPATGKWTLGAPAPIPGRVEADEIWTGQEALLWGGGTQSGIYCCNVVKSGYSYRP